MSRLPSRVSLVLLSFVLLFGTGCFRARGRVCGPLSTTYVSPVAGSGRALLLRRPGPLPAPTEAKSAPHVRARPVIPAPPPAVHRVRRGETLYGIAKRYGVELERLAHANGIRNTRRLAAGRSLTIPAPESRSVPEMAETIETPPVAPAISAQPSTAAPAPVVEPAKPELIDGAMDHATESRRAVPSEASYRAEKLRPMPRPPSSAEPIPESYEPEMEDEDEADNTASESSDLEPGEAGSWMWPVQGELASGFGPRGRRGRQHRGVDLLVPSGTPVRATREGVVRFAGRMRGFGNLLIIDHEGGFASYYAHNRKHLVREGERVAQGETIAESGRTGNATTPHVHFELRRNGYALDPLSFLAPRATPE